MRAHGTRSAYNGGCRCDECREAQREYQAMRYRGLAHVCPICDRQAVNAYGLRVHMNKMHTPAERLLAASRPAFDLNNVNCAGQHQAMFPSTADGVDEAKAICVGCPVSVECLAWALGNGETVGVWGGVNLASRDERREARRRFR